jgi:hypothetical protein
MDETQTTTVVVKGNHTDKVVKTVIGAVAGYAITQLTDMIYDKLIVEGRLKALLRRK